MPLWSFLSFQISKYLESFQKGDCDIHLQVIVQIQICILKYFLIFFKKYFLFQISFLSLLYSYITQTPGKKNCEKISSSFHSFMTDILQTDYEQAKNRQRGLLRT